MVSRKYAMPETAAITSGVSLWQGLLHSAVLCLCLPVVGKQDAAQTSDKAAEHFPIQLHHCSLKKKGCGDAERGRRYLSIKVAFAATR